MNDLLKSKEFYNQACGIKNTNEDVILLKNKLRFECDIPEGLIGLLKEFCYEKPQYYWNRDVATEVFENLNKYILCDIDKFNSAIESSTIELFEAIRAYESITKIISEIRNVAFEQGFKTKIFRNPVFSQLCEDLLMNLYRVLRNIVNEYSDKDYSNQNTLTPIVQCLQKNGFLKGTDINVNLRNAVNHGNVFISGNQINYRFGKHPNYQTESINYWQYDDILDETYDIASGILMGILKTFSNHPEVIETHAVSSQENAVEWFKLMYKNEKVKIQDISFGNINTSQINISIETNIAEKDYLIFALIELAKSAFMFFPDFERYLVGYTHNRSVSGFIRLTNDQLQETFEIPELYKGIINSGEILMFDILNTEINENAYKYHVFPKIKAKTYEVIDVQDCSINNYKRLKANLILSERMSKKKIRAIISRVILDVSKFETPQNPYDNVSWGTDKADIVLINVFVNNPNRKKFNLLIDNKAFVGMAHYYKSDSCPRLKHGGIMEGLWNKYKKEKIKNNITIAWNPNYKNI